MLKLVLGGALAEVADDGVDQRHRGAGHGAGVGCDDKQAGVGLVEHGDVEGFDAELVDRTEAVEVVSGAQPEPSPWSDGFGDGDRHAVAHAAVEAQHALHGVGQHGVRA